MTLRESTRASACTSVRSGQFARPTPMGSKAAVMGTTSAMWGGVARERSERQLVSIPACLPGPHTARTVARGVATNCAGATRFATWAGCMTKRL
eukprot:152754-Chlamydomonas_euryale.AAC.6